MVLGVAAPICGWLIAACVSSSIGAWQADGSSGSSRSSSSSSSSSNDRKAAGLGPGISRRRRCSTRSRAGVTRSISSSGTVGSAEMGGSRVIGGRLSSLSGVSTSRIGSSSSSSSISSVSHSTRRRVSASGAQALLARRRRMHLLPTSSSSSSRPFSSLGVHRTSGLSSSSSVFLSSSPSGSLSQRLAQVPAPAFSAAAAIASGSRPLRRRTRSMARTGDVAAKAVAAAQQQEAVQVQQKQQPGVGEAEGEGRRRGLAEEKKTRRVVVTGMGVVSCLGHDPDTFYNNLLEGKSGVTTIQGFDASGFPTRIAGEIQGFDYQGYVQPKMAKRMDKYMWYLLTAGKKALEHAGIGVADARTEFDPLKCGVLIGSAMGGMQVFHDAVEALKVSYRRMNPFCIPFVTTNMGSAMLAMDLGWMGPNYSISTACATANYCILSAAQHIVRGEADVMLSGGSDAAVLPIGMGGFVACKALSKRNDEPSRASRPWDVDRDGFVMGEGAGVLVLEELEHAKARGATIYAEFLGGSFTCDAYHMTDPHPQGNGVRLCIERAMADSGVKPEWVNYVNAHATSTPAGDLQEYKAIVNALGLTDPARRGTVRMNATKSMIGHLLGAAGAVEAIATVQAIRTGWLHPTLNVDTPEQDVDPSLLVRGEKQALKVKAALSNSFGFGGHNSSIIFAPYHPDGLGAYVESLEREEAAAAAAASAAADASAGAGSSNGGL